jgi:hypothetical protein
MWLQRRILVFVEILTGLVEHIMIHLYWLVIVFSKEVFKRTTHESRISPGHLG